MNRIHFTRTLLSAALAVVSLGTVVTSAAAATWAPINSGQRVRTLEVTSTTTVPVPAPIAARGGTMRFTLVGGGEGGHASKSSCDDYAIQGGRGGDGGEVIELELSVQPGQCAAGFGVVVGAGGKGAFRGNNATSAGEPGTSTVLSCSGTPIAAALGGGKRPDAATAAKSSKGGSGGVVMNALDAVGDAQLKQRSTAIEPAGDGQDGRGGYGSGGGGGGASLALAGTAVRPDGTVTTRSTVRNAPVGKPGYGGGSGAGPNEYGSTAISYAAENAAQYGAGGGGGAASCGTPVTARDGGNGFQGLLRVQWSE